MRLPEVASRLRKLAVELECDELAELALEISRRPSEQRAPITSTPMTDKLRSEIKLMKQLHPFIAQTEIARRLNINPGRVSETLIGKRL